MFVLLRPSVVLVVTALLLFVFLYFLWFVCVFSLFVYSLGYLPDTNDD